MALVLRPMFRYFGSKWKISTLLPPPKVFPIVEPFAGSAGYSLRYGAHQEVRLNDLNPTVVELWDFLIHARESEVLRIPLIRPGQRVSELRTSSIGKKLVGMWIARAKTEPQDEPSCWMFPYASSDGRSSTSFWGESIRARIADQLQYIRRWKVTEASYEKLTVRGRATWMVDPPYQRLGKHYARGSDGIDFKALATWCRARRGQVMVTEEKGAEWLPFEHLKTYHCNFRTIERRTTEVVWYGGRA